MQPVFKRIVPLLPSFTAPTKQITETVRAVTKLLSGTSAQALLCCASPKLRDTLEVVVCKQHVEGRCGFMSQLSKVSKVKTKTFHSP